MRACNPPLTWDELRLIRDVAVAGSLAAAAAVYGADAATVSRKVAQIERRLGTMLFERRVGGVSPTAITMKILPVLTGLGSTIMEISQSLLGVDGRLEGDVRIGCTEGLGASWLTPRLVPFMLRNPGIRVIVAPSLMAGTNEGTRNGDRVADGSDDIAIRFSAPTDGCLKRLRVGTMRFSMYCSQEYADTYGTPKCATELSSHRLVDFNPDELPSWLALRSNSTVIGFQTASSTCHLYAIKSGHGIGMLPKYIQYVEPTLVEIQIIIKETLPIFLVTHADSGQNARTQATLQHLKDEFERDRATWFA